MALAALLAPALHAQQPAPQPAQQTEPLALTEAMSAGFDTQIGTTERQRAEITVIENRLAASEGVLGEILQQRLEQDRLAFAETSVAFARAVDTAADAGYLVDDYGETAVAMMQTNLELGFATWDSLDERAEFPQSDLNAAEQAARNHAFYETQRSINRTIGLLSDSYELLAELGAPQEAERAAFADRVRERAVNASIYLGMAREAATAARATADAVPDDTELSARVNVATDLVSRTARLFERALSEFERLGGNTAFYRQQIITATGELTLDVFSFAVFRELATQWGRSLLDTLEDRGPIFLFRMLVFLLILFVFYKLSRVMGALVKRAIYRSNAGLSQLLKDMIVSSTANVVLIIGFLFALSQLGISLGPLLAGLGIAGFIIGFALQDSLANFASGLMILFYRPYDVGDVVEFGDVFGKVVRMSLVNTTVNTYDNQRIILPNSMIWGNKIKNITAERVRRVDMSFSTSHADDIPKTEEVLKQVLSEHELVLEKPEPIVRVNELTDTAVNFIVWPWVRTENYWDVYWDITRAVKLRFDEAGITIPFPQRDVRLVTERASPSEREADGDSKKTGAVSASL